MSLCTIFAADFLIHFCRPWAYGMTMCPLLGWGGSFSGATAGAVSPFFYGAFLGINFLLVAI